LVQEEDRPLIEEHTIAGGRGMLGGRTLETTPEGKMQRTNFAATCEECGLYPLDRFVMCVSCRKRLCPDCAVKMNRVPYCLPHLMERLPMSRASFLTLMCVEAGVDNVGEIHDLTKIPKDDVKAALAFLAERKLISKSGLFAFLERKITADGLHVLSVFKKVYNEEDVAAVEQQLNGEDQDGD
jgi:hypothetical protein